MTTTNNTRITFRTKFEKLLNDHNREIITAAFEKFCDMDSTSACDTLWYLTYNKVITITTLNELGLNLEIIPYESMSLFRNELRFQYANLNPDFLIIDIPDECRDAFTDLENHTDSIVANVVYGNCKPIVYYDTNAIARLLFLLGSNKESNYYGGIRALHFNNDESEYLKPFHLQIHNLLKALCDYHAINDNSFKNLPFARLGNLIEESGMELSDDIEEMITETCNESQDEATTDFQPELMNDMPLKLKPETAKKITRALTEFPTKEIIQADSEYEPLVPEIILVYQDIFTSLVEKNDMNALLPIGMLGFDLNEVMAKREKIKNLLKTAEAISE